MIRATKEEPNMSKEYIYKILVYKSPDGYNRAELRRHSTLKYSDYRMKKMLQEMLGARIISKGSKKYYAGRMNYGRNRTHLDEYLSTVIINNLEGAVNFNIVATEKIYADLDERSLEIFNNNFIHRINISNLELTDRPIKIRLPRRNKDITYY